MDNFLETLKNLGPSRLILMAGTFLALVVFFIFIIARSSVPSLTLLYNNLSVADSTEIAARLDTAKINYQLNADSTQVSVPQKDVARARMLLAETGLPRQGSMGYEIFDQKQRFGTTSFEQNISQLRALEGELSRTISTIEQIRSARVHLVLPQRELFSRDTQPATASVFLNLHGNASLGAEQIKAIQHLVAAAVPQLKSTRVAITDQNGNLLATGEEDDSTTTTARDGEELRHQYERRLAKSIEDMVGRIVGFGRVRATVSASLDFDVISRNSETYDPDGQVVRSTQAITDESIDGSGGMGGNVSVETNLPGLPGGTGGAGAGGSRANRTEEVTNFEISRTIENVVRASGDVKKLSIAVLLDGTYAPDPNAARPDNAPAGWEAPRVYTPRSQDELDKITALVKSATGYDETRGDTIEVVNMQFADIDTGGAGSAGQDMIMGFARADIISMAETLALSIVAILIILLVLRPLATHFTASHARNDNNNNMGGESDLALLTGMAGGGMQPQLAGPDGAAMVADPANAGELEAMIDMSSVEGKVKASSVHKINELVTNYPNETVSVIRQWMQQEN